MSQRIFRLGIFYVPPHQIQLFFFLTSLLEYNCLTMMCQFLLYNKVSQLYIYICSHISSLLCLPPSLPPSLSHPSRWSQSTQLISLAMRLLPTSCFTFGSVYMSVLLSHFVPAYPPPPHVLKSFLYICVFIPVLPLGSSEPLFFFQIPYICVSVQYLFFYF